MSTHGTAASQRAWRAKNSERARANEKAYRERRRDAYAQWSQEWRERNPEKLKAAQRRRTLKRYGLTETDYHRMLTAQSECCAICHERPPLRKTRSGRKYERLDIDHDHDTARVRGLLCCNCNAILGHAGDDVALLQAAIRYIEQNR